MSNAGRIDNFYIILPDGRHEYVDPASLPADVEFEPIEFPFVTGDRFGQMEYEASRLDGFTHDAAIINAAMVAFGSEVTGKALDLSTNDAGVRVRYLELRLAGQSHNMAEILACRKFPGVKTDAVFNHGKFSGQNPGHCESHQAWLMARAKAAGVSTNGKWYCSGLASFPGDPSAWIDSRGDVLRVAREKNLDVQGYVEHRAREVDPGGDLDVAPDILSREVDQLMSLDPSASRAAVEDRVKGLLTGRVDNHPLLVNDTPGD